MKRLPFIFTGWFWHVTTILPVMGMIPSGNFWIADHYNYLPSIGIAVGLAWGIPLLFPSKETRNKILFPAGIGVLAVLSVLTWRQCGYWKNSIIIMNHSLQVTNGDSFQHNTLALAWLEKGNVEEAIGHYTESIRIKSNYFDTVLAYGNRGIAYAALKKYEIAIEDFNEAIRLKPDYADIYNNRGNAYYALGQYERAVGDYNEVIRLRPDNPFAYKNRSNAYFSRGNNNLGCNDARKACELGNCQLLEAAKGKGLCR
jgi:tetratricopeptide (TPR) repeat protein